MQLDIAILILLALFCVLGFKNGLFYTLSQSLGWLTALAAAYFSYKGISAYLKGHTTIYDQLYSHVEKICSRLAPESTSAGADGFGSVFYSYWLDAVKKAAENISSAIFYVIVFLSVLLMAKLILYIIMKLLSRRHRDDFVGTMDATAGLLLGFVQGLLVIFIMLLILFPIAFTINPIIFERLQDWMDHSFITGFLYKNNPLFLLIEGYAPNTLSPDTWISGV